MEVERMRIYLEEAIRELEAGIKEDNAYKIRDSAEKAWNAVIQATNSLILKYMGKLPSTHWERRKLLRELEKQEPKARELMLRDRYGARERHLHEMVFYEGIIDVEDVKYEFEKVLSYIDDVKRLIGYISTSKSKNAIL